ncbi:hypothetical protein H7K45_22430 [Mycobacterium yunnanensis]|uniref:Cysteine-rich secretory protein family protein n=1 Tax=Mycobacterium yunnanensis TaxID=368477 RepID=A0A9X2Z5K3_9MYCO|nr:CAP domain-containing protein [Mycobacterium yunnanensis]MCV7423314.1 hypothetical protein [Mycobacterium yunnanensis]
MSDLGPRRPSVAPVAVVVALLGAAIVAGGSTTPTARADDPLAPIITSVIAYRSNSGCPKLNYDTSLEAAAQKYARSEVRSDGIPRDYAGQTAAFLGSGDPQDVAILSAYARGARAMVNDCTETDFGVGFIRHEDRSVDVVTMLFGSPANETPGPPVPTPAPTPSPTPAPAPPKVAPTDAVRVSFDKGLQWTVNVTSTADIAGTCTYAATNPVLPGTNRTFAIQPRGSASFTVLAPPPFSTYHVVVACRGTFDGRSVEFGHVEQDVSS